MTSDEAPKSWGTIFMGAEREVNLEQLSAVAPKRDDVWSRGQEETYLERVQRRAEEQARTILEQAGRERAALLEEAHGEIARMREEAEQQATALLTERRSLQAEAARLHEEARLLHAASEEAGHTAGYAAGIEQAQAELEHFRAVMGESTGAVLSAVHAQCDRIFEVWKEDLCGLLLACVEKGTGLILDKDRASLLEQLLLDSIKLFADRSSVVVRVQSDDEAVVADMFAAAKERIPGLGSWNVLGDPELAPGDLVLEAMHSRVEGRIEERRGLVDAALRHLSLPGVPEEEEAHEEVARIHAGAVARMLELVPKRPPAPAAPHDAAMVDNQETSHPEAENAVLSADDAAEETLAEAQTPELPTEPPVPKVDLSQILGHPSGADSVTPDATDAIDAMDAMDAVDAVLAEGGFLSAPEEA